MKHNSSPPQTGHDAGGGRPSSISIPFSTSSSAPSTPESLTTPQQGQKQKQKQTPNYAKSSFSKSPPSKQSTSSGLGHGHGHGQGLSTPELIRFIPSVNSLDVLYKISQSNRVMTNSKLREGIVNQVKKLKASEASKCTSPPKSKSRSQSPMGSTGSSSFKSEVRRECMRPLLKKTISGQFNSLPEADSSSSAATSPTSPWRHQYQHQHHQHHQHHHHHQQQQQQQHTKKRNSREIIIASPNSTMEEISSNLATLKSSNLLIHPSQNSLENRGVTGLIEHGRIMNENAERIAMRRANAWKRRDTRKGRAAKKVRIYVHSEKNYHF